MSELSAVAEKLEDLIRRHFGLPCDYDLVDPIVEDFLAIVDEIRAADARERQEG